MKCRNCNAEIEYRPGIEKLCCPYCGNLFEPDNYQSEKDNYADIDNSKEQVNNFKAVKYCCKNCGAELLTKEETAVTFCSYCGSNQIIKEKLVDVVSPKYIIPFNISKKDAIERYKNKINSFIFAPSYMKNDIVIKKIRGIYMPYGIYSSINDKTISNKGSKYSYTDGTYDYYIDYNIRCRLNSKYQGVSFDLLSKFYDRLSEGIGPFDFKKVKEFNENYLAGFYADSSDVDNYTYEENAKNIISTDISTELKKQKEFKEYGCIEPKADITISNVETAYYPVYFLSILNKKKNKIFYAAINGQNGKLSVDMPIDFTKYIIFSLIISSLLFLLIKNITFTPKILLIICMVLHIFSLIFQIKFYNKIKVKKLYLDDLGLLSVNDIPEEVENFKIKRNQRMSESKVAAIVLLIIIGLFALVFGFSSFLNDEQLSIAIVSATILSILIIIIEIIKNRRPKDIAPYKIKVKFKINKHNTYQLIGIIISLLVLLSGTIMDEYYYVSILISLFMLILTYFDLAKLYNDLVSRKIPQLDKRGGDEYE